MIMRLFDGARIDTFLASIVFCIFIPLFPLIISCVFNKTETTDWVLTAALYPASLFIQSQSKSLFAVGIGILVFFAICLSLRGQDMTLILIYAKYTIWAVSFTHFFERFLMHIVKGERFFNFN